jgi:hypothetical protein
MCIHGLIAARSPRGLDQSRMQTSPRDKHSFGAGPKRILALDGGEVRRVISSDSLFGRSAYERFLLCDSFDLVGETVVGATIASLDEDRLGTQLSRAFDRKAVLKFRDLSHAGYMKTLHEFSEKQLGADHLGLTANV